MKFSVFNIIICSLFSITLLSCNSDNEDEPKPSENLLQGYWALTHIKTIIHNDGSHETSDQVIKPHNANDWVEGHPYHQRFDVLLFDSDYVTWRGSSLPSTPRMKDFDVDTPEGQLEYYDAVDKWYTDAFFLEDQFGFPVGNYKIKDDKLIFGSVNMGTIHFESKDIFTLEYKMDLGKDNYRFLTYTYSRIYNLSL